MGTRFLTRRHIALLGFDPVSRNRHFASIFGIGVGTSLPARKLGGVKDNGLGQSLGQSIESSRSTNKGLDSVYPSSQG
jgi:hypothetical protein